VNPKRTEFVVEIIGIALPEPWISPAAPDHLRGAAITMEREQGVLA
jgi:hypothetical protein